MVSWPDLTMTGIQEYKHIEIILLAFLLEQKCFLWIFDPLQLLSDIMQ